MRKFFTFITAILFAGSMFAETAVLQYSGATTNMAGDGANNAASVGLDDSYFTVLAEKGQASNNIGLNKDGSIRLYAHKDSGDGNTLIVSMKGGKINTIALDIKQTATFTVKAGEGDDAVDATLADGKYTINSTQFAIKNTTSGATTQLQLYKITIEYELDGSVLAKPVILPDVVSFSGSLEVSITAAEGAKIYYTLDESDPTTASPEYAAPFSINATTLVKAIAAKGDQISPIAEKKFSVLDTVSVSEARQLIDNNDAAPHFVRGVVAGKVFDANKTFNGKLCIWMTDEKNSKDSLEAYQIYAGPEDKAWESLIAAQELIGEGDTILIYAKKLTLYAAKNYYEADGGYFVKVLAKYIEDPTIQYETLNVAQAIAKAEALADNAQTETKYYVEGFTDYVQAINPLKGTQSFFLEDDLATADQDSAFQAYLAAPRKDGKLYPVLAGDKVKAFGYIKKYIDTKNGNAVILEIVEPDVEFLIEVPGDRTVEIPKIDTLTVAKALEIGGALADNAVSEKEYMIEGYVSYIEENYSASAKNETFWIADTKESTAASNADGAFYIYRGKPDIQEEIGTGAHVFVLTKIKKYVSGTKSVIENENANCDVTVKEKGVVEEVEAISVARAVEIGQSSDASLMGSDGVSLKRYEITGYVSYIEELYNPLFGNETFWITDEEGSKAHSSADKAFEIYRGKPSTKAEIGEGGQIKVICKIKNYKGTIENNGSNIDVEVLKTVPIVFDTVTVEKAFAIGEQLGDGNSSDGFYAVKGYISFIKTAYSASNKNLTMYVSDDPTATARGERDVQCYQAKMSAEDAAKAVTGAYTITCGRMKYSVYNEKGSVEITRGNSKIAEAPKLDTININVAKALEIAESLEIDEKTNEIYGVIGYVAKITSFDEEAYVQSFQLSDDETATAGSFFAEEANILSDDLLTLHQRVRVVGKIVKEENAAGTGFVVKIVEGDAAPYEGFPQGIENVKLTDNAHKVLVDGVIYIVRDGKMFNLQGAQVR